MTLSRQLDRLHIYQILIFLAIAILWSVYILSITAAAKKDKKTTIKKNNKTVKNIYRLLTVEKHMIICNTVCFFPLLIIQSFRAFPTLDLQNYHQFSSVGNLSWNFSIYIASRLVVFNSLIDCIIYNWYNKYLRKLPQASKSQQIAVVETRG